MLHRMDAAAEMRNAAGDRLEVVCIVERSGVRAVSSDGLPDVSGDIGDGLQVPGEQQGENQGRCTARHSRQQADRHVA